MSHRARGNQRPIQLGLHGLESRDVPANLLVTSAADAGMGSLRAMLAVSNTNAEADTITFASFITTINLTTGQLTISENQGLIVDGAGKVSINGAGAASATNRLFNISGSGTSKIELCGLALTHGNVTGDGGAILANGRTLSLTNMVLSNNSATGNGGAMSSTNGGDITVSHSQLTNNKASAGGAGYFQANSSVTFDTCSITGNTATSSSSTTGGGAVFSNGYSVFNYCTIDHNVANYGAGFYLQSFIIVLDGCTVSDNSAAISGGGVRLQGASPTIRYCTFAGNTGGGITRSITNGGPIIMYNTIIATNIGSPSPDISLQSLVSINGYNNLIGNNEASNANFTGAGNLLGTSAAPIDPLLAPLANYGGPVQTHALLGGSPAIDAAADFPAVTIDERGYQRVFNGLPDIGAYELTLPRVASVVVNGGAAQRSRVTSMTVNFDSVVTLPVVSADAFSLKRQSDGITVGLAGTVTNTNVTSVTFSFTGGALDFGSLQDGRYTLTVFGNVASNANGGLDGNGDGVGGDNYQLVGTPSNGLFRLYGDADGNGFIDGLDFAAFRSAFNTNSSVFDFNGSGTVDGSDFMQFQTRFAQAI